MNRIAKRIKDVRKLKGLTQEELAELSNVNLRTIQRIENNKNEPRRQTLVLICNVLAIDINEFANGESIKRNTLGNKIVNVLFLVVLNLILMGIVGFLTLDSKANINSVFGGFLLSVFIPLFIVQMTKKMSGLERLIKFGSGYFSYFLLVIFNLGFPIGFLTGLFPCLLISLFILYFGSLLIRNYT